MRRQEGKHFLAYLFWGQRIGIDVEVGVAAGVAEAMEFFLPPPPIASRGPSILRRLSGDSQVDQEIGLSDLLPHRRGVRVFLGHLVSIVPPSLERLNQRRLARCARSHNGDSASVDRATRTVHRWERFSLPKRLASQEVALLC